ncbi:MAG: ATP-binding cassette domain-containing protein [Clostridia bacterium]|nr:ATP-binding cassette domain-containing protein [Clostridia bacterium]MBQ5957256.1 ATP-binding cassette domain-containing protein [Clostridia bacterium]MBQ6004374.1 ATP-binding cassette domain-containing protein [Clostridia bacterium]MBR3563293.1 ATP-binding cassette domain-containing protein [Clostridia bacterium]MBR6136492.1 ATP-binding cassette domain-containing protein [Clostridia bacterium]
MEKEMIRVSGLIKRYGAQTVLDYVSFSVNRGECLGIIGNNGSGKTVLIKCICGFVRPTEGTVTVNEKTIGKDTDFIENAGIIIESPGFLNSLSGFRNLEMLASMNGRIGRKEIEEILRKVGLSDTGNKKVMKYSLGMRQRLGLAQAIMEAPEILLLDEPFNGLDRNGLTEMRDLLLSMKSEGTTIVLASHNAEDISILCDKTIELDGGKIIDERIL